MKNSGIEWIGEIPAHWNIRKGKWILKRLERPVEENDGVITCFRDGEVTLRSNRREEGFTVSLQEVGYQGIEPGDLVVHGMDGFAGAIGISDSRGKGTPVLNILDSTENKKYIMYYLRNMAYNGIFLALATGIRVRSCDTSWNKLKELPYIIPNIEEQKEIADYLDKKCAEIDAVIAKTKATIEEYKKLKQSIITDAVTKGIRGDRPMKKSGVEWIGDIPVNWEVKKLKYTSEFKQNKYSQSDGELRYIGLENIVAWNGHYVETESDYDREQSLICENYDILFGKLRPYLAKVYISPEKQCCSGEFCVISIKEQSTKYMWYQLISHGFIFMVDRSTYGTKMPRANADYIKNMSVSIPPIEEQREIVAYLDEKCAKMDTLIEKKTALLAEMESYKKSVIYEYVTGKKEVK